MSDKKIINNANNIMMMSYHQPVTHLRIYVATHPHVNVRR